jgi:serine/threonine protein kinase
MIGDIVGTYRLVQKLGEGSMGEVFLGQHTQSAEQAAVKVLFAPFSKQGMALTRYFAELRSTNALGSSGIAKIYDCGTHTSGRAFVCMEFLAGRSLAAALVDLPIGDMTTIVTLGTEVAAALEGVHGRRMIHRALKPDGIFLTAPMPRPTVKLLDFGVANFTQSVRQSQTGSLLGAPLYMSPEVGRGLGQVDHRADIYSLGCILFELATGRPPFVREGAGELIIAHSTEVPPSARELEPTLAPALDGLLARMLRKDPAQRPQSMTEVAAALRACAIPAAEPAPIFAPTPGLVVAAPLAHAAPAFAAPPPASSWPPLTPPVAPLPAASSASLARPATPGSSRHQDATVLLASSDGDAMAASGPHPTTHSTQNSPRPVQPTAFLDPPTPRKPRARSLPTPPPEARRLRSDLPLFLVGGAAVLCIVAVIVVLIATRSSTSVPISAPSPRPSSREQFEPPAPPRPATSYEEKAVRAPSRPERANEASVAREKANDRGSSAPSQHRARPSKPRDDSKAPARQASPADWHHW